MSRLWFVACLGVFVAIAWWLRRGRPVLPARAPSALNRERERTAPTPTPRVEATFTARPTETPTRTPTRTATPQPTRTPSQTPTPSATPLPTRTPTRTATPLPTLTPTPTLTPSPTQTPTPADRGLTVEVTLKPSRKTHPRNRSIELLVEAVWRGSAGDVVVGFPLPREMDLTNLEIPSGPEIVR